MALRGKTVSVAVAALAVGLLGVAVYHLWWQPGPPLSPARTVLVQPGQGLRTIAPRLRQQGVVPSALALEVLARMLGVAGQLKPGLYQFVGGESPSEVLGHLVRGDALFVTVTIPEGLTVHQIAQRLEAARLLCAEQFEQAARRSPLIDAVGLAPLGAEGYLFPATYRFAPQVTPRQVLVEMLRRFTALLTPAVTKRIFELGLTVDQLITLASMVEKEAKVPAERPLIAGVFYNRLHLNMPLQSDPTAQYSFDGAQLPVAQAVHTPSAFNTYAFAGLPPGPIANPGQAAIQAALYPTPTNYLYFVARQDGTHIFSRSLKEHDRAIESLRMSHKTAAPPTELGRH
ncbi:MAG TPA: endolytic transglycosylase MltG [Candidatus Binataceae bacterium]|nr:endolytic transglycosylase MltG [Candidatus Binataceae bacterium]